MAETPHRRRNWALWLGTGLVLVGVAIGAPQVYALNVPQRILPWLGLVIPAAAVLCFVVGLLRAFKQPQIYRGRVLGSILGVVSLLLFAGSVWLHVHVRDVPASASAPKLGQKAPDFTLQNTSGQPVSLSQMLSTPIDTATGKTPKAVLLIFYRGYW